MGIKRKTNVICEYVFKRNAILHVFITTSFQRISLDRFPLFLISESTNTYGNDLVGGTTDDDHRFLHIMTNHPMPSGTVKRFNAYLTKNTVVTVQIYRPVPGSSGKYTLIAEERIIPSATGAIEVIMRSQCIA